MRQVTLMYVLLAILGLAYLAGCEKQGPMPQSNFTYLQKIRDGVIFSEGFENDNFVTAEGWTVLQGVPGNSSSQYKDGIKSWDNQANSTLPIAKKIINFTQPSGELQVIRVWFYDTMDTTSPGPYLKIKYSSGSFVSLGVRNSVSTTKYCYATASGVADQPTTVFSATTRSLGWHLFQIIIQKPGTNYQFQVDGIGSGNIGSTLGNVTEIYLHSDRVGGPGPSFGYFDSLGLFIGRNVSIKFPNSTDQYRAILYSQTNVTIDDTGMNLGSDDFDFVTDGITIIPFPGFIQMSSTNLSTKCLNRTPLLYLNPGDIYQLKIVSFGQKFKPYNPQLMALKDQNISTSGVTETIFNAYKNKYVVGVPMLEGMSYKESFDEWYNYAVQGNPFSAQVDDRYVGFGVIDSNPAVGTNVLQIKPNLSTLPTDSFIVNRKYVLFNAANTRRQVVTLNAKNDPCLSFVENFEFPFANLDYVADIVFHPFLELGQNPYGLRMMDERYIRFSMNQTVEDWNGG